MKLFECANIMLLIVLIPTVSVAGNFDTKKPLSDTNNREHKVVIPITNKITVKSNESFDTVLLKSSFLVKVESSHIDSSKFKCGCDIKALITDLNSRESVNSSTVQRIGN